MENLKKYLHEKDAKKAINKYLVDNLDAKIVKGEIFNLDECYNIPKDEDIDSYLDLN